MKQVSFLFPLLLSYSLRAQNNHMPNTLAYSPISGILTTIARSQFPTITIYGYQNDLIRISTGTNITAGGSFNTLYGADSGHSLTTGSRNTFMGYLPGYSTTTGNDNFFIGFRTGYSNTTGNSNFFIGTDTGYHTTTADFNSFVGNEAGFLNTTGNNDTFLGYRSGYANTTGSNNTYLGWRAGRLNTTGSSNVFVGSEAGVYNTTSSQNTFVGYQAGTVSTAIGNTFLGYQAGVANTSGQYNVFIGTGAGQANTSGTQNTFIGSGAGTSTGNLTNATAIGNNAKVNVSNALVLGAGANVGIGTSAPTNKLHIVSGVAGVSGLRLENLINTSAASVTNQTKFLTVDGSGNVILGNFIGSPREGVSELLWQRTGQSLQSVAGSRVIIGEQVSSTATGYRLYVEEGILTEKVKVAVKNTAEWSDKVFELNYNLKSLTELETYVKAHHHLPGIPSAQEMVEQGNDLHKTDAKLLEKIEELTLYCIQLQKENRLQKDELWSIKQNYQQQQAKVDELERLVNKLIQKK